MTSSRRIDWRLAVGCALLLTLLFGLQQSMGPTPARRDLDLTTALGLQGVTWGVWLALLPLIVRAAGRHPLLGRPLLPWALRTTAEGAAFIVAHTVVSGTLRWALGLSVSSDFGTVIANSFSAGFASNVLRYAAILLVYQAVVYHDAVRNRDQRAADLELDLARARLSNVEACLRPHFLFNTLNAIAALVREDPRLAEAMIGQLSDLLRASLYTDESGEVRLDQELTFTEKYLDLERVRFPDRLRVNLDIAPETRQALVPHLMLQPLVENAVRHGLAPLEGGGSIAVTAARQNGLLRVTVRDDGVGITRASTDQGGVGLRGLRARLDRLYGADHRLDLQPGTPRGTVVEIEIPFRQ